MTIVLRVVLILVSVCTLAYVIRKIRHSKMQIEDSIFWIFFSVLLVILSAIPKLADWLAELIGIYSTVNFIFLFFIAILLIKIFMMSVKLSLLETKINEIVQKIAVDKIINKEADNKKE